MKIYNTVTRKKEEFVPLHEGKVGIYVCGPTVYNYFHIGNARPFIVFDTLRRYLEFRGYQVNYVQNFTDIDDKMIRRANEEEITVKELAERFIVEYFVDTKGLGIREATAHPKATESMDDIIAIVSKLIANGFAYEIEGDVYFDTEKFKGYGKLSGYNLDELESGSRVDVDERKRKPVDFALWKSQKPGEPAWESPWGLGRPGWHIECSAMAMRYIGETIDIHCGGQDLIFPHHENEIAQSEAATGKPFARYWMHNGFINVDNEKMSKSAGNFFMVRDVVKKFDYEIIRFFMLSSQYRSPINFADTLLEQAKMGLERIYNCLSNLDFLKANEQIAAKPGVNVKSKLDQFRAKFIDAMDDDLNTADAISVIFEGVREINASVTADTNANIKDIEDSIQFIRELGDVLGIAQKQENCDLDAEVERLIEERQAARKDKNWALADQIRDQLKEMGIVLEDTPQGIKWRKT